MDALRQETRYHLEELDLPAWTAAGGDLHGTPDAAVWAVLL